VRRGSTVDGDALVRVHSGRDFALSSTSEQQLSYTSRAPSERDGVRTAPAPSARPQLDEFIADHQTAFRDAMAAALRGRGDVDDALQQAYLRLMAEYHRWPPELTDRERLTFAYRIIQLAAKDVLRREFGRADRAPRPREIQVDFSEDGREAAEASGASSIRLLAQQRLSETASRYPGDEEHLDTALKVAALAALDPIAHQIVTASQLGFNHKQVAEELGLSHQTVRAKDSEARALVFSLIACANGRDIREATDIKLFGYLEGQKLSRAERRLVQGHLKHCAGCQEVAALAGQVDAVAQGLVLPLPVLLGASALGHLVGAKAAVFASAGPNGSVLASSASAGGVGAGTGFGGIASLGAGKLATGLAILAVAGAGAAAAVTLHQTKPHASADSAHAGAASTIAAAGLSKALPAAAAAPARPVAQLRHRRRRHHRPAAKPRPTPARAAAPALSTSTAASAPAATSPPSTPTRQSAPRGGEFVLGGGQ
jgi:RNA polymerase sigma factor (sigma-70 family)